MKPVRLPIAFILAAGLAGPLQSFAVDAERRAEVAVRGAEVMPFDLRATTHVFTRSKDGGRQRVIAKDPSDSHQIRLIRRHLRMIQAQFQRGDFSAPEAIHGADMPGLAQLKAAQPGQISVTYHDVRRGAELIYRSRDPKLVSALHAWFDAQLADHGADAMSGHEQHRGMAQP